MIHIWGEEADDKPARLSKLGGRNKKKKKKKRHHRFLFTFIHRKRSEGDEAQKSF